VYPPVLLIGFAILLGHLLLMRRARSLGLEARLAGEFSAVAVVAGFFVAHIAKFLYLDAGLAALWRSPLLLLQVWRGLASLGGIVGGLAAGVLWLRMRGQDWWGVIGFLDALAFVFPFAWIWGRAHCAWVHDHPGIPTESWLGVAYPGGARFDLGLLEVLFLAFVISAFLWLDRQPRAMGFYLGAFLLSYGLFRLLLDNLHERVIRHAGLSPDQWGSAVLLALGIFMIWSIRRRGKHAKHWSVAH
jgi:phosphatidylglycerol:prolipoprotein diacylglycerol transferase